jgi:hypothetical protein
VGSSLNQRAAEFSLCNTLALLLDLAFKQYVRNAESPSSSRLDYRFGILALIEIRPAPTLRLLL